MTLDFTKGCVLRHIMIAKDDYRGIYFGPVKKEGARFIGRVIFYDEEDDLGKNCFQGSISFHDKRNIRLRVADESSEDDLVTQARTRTLFNLS
jgi:hypothetical protein